MVASTPKKNGGVVKTGPKSSISKPNDQIQDLHPFTSSLEYLKLRPTPRGPSQSTHSVQKDIGLGRPIQMMASHHDVLFDNLTIHHGTQISTHRRKEKEIKLASSPSKQASSLKSVIRLDKYKEMVEIGKESLKKMPTVITSVNGRKMEGILYKYVNNVVCIVCVCHGKFLSAEEFIKHAGGDDVMNPLKHISVCTTF